MPVIVAVPHNDIEDYKYLKDIFKSNFYLVTGNEKDPLARCADVCNDFGLESFIRVTHDKIFIDPVAVKILNNQFEKEKLDYIYSGSFIDGAAFEIISTAVINRAAKAFKNVEFISYAVRCVTSNIKSVDLSSLYTSDHRLLVDYPEDLKVLELVLHSLGNECTLKDAICFLDQHQWISRINRTPKVTVYTCAYNAEKWLYRCMGSVSEQNIFGECEYILIDDRSKDASPLMMSKFCHTYKNAKWIRNDTNIGLASSSNLALSLARGRYIIRIDADDYFSNDHALEMLVNECNKQNADIVYPDNYFGNYKMIQRGEEKHHAGGALFRTRAANHIKFTDALRNYEGLDVFIRAKDQLNIAYLNKPLFFYRQHDNSMSKTNLTERQRVYEAITGKPEQPHARG